MTPGDYIPAPAFIGCVRCGDEWPPETAVFVQCQACGKVCGVCFPCSRLMGLPFLREAMAWHRARKHPDLALPRLERQRLLSADGEFRKRGERLEL